MDRKFLRAIVALGLVISLATGAGVFAAFTDRATAGPNTIETGALPSAADLKLAMAEVDAADNWTCGEYSDDVTTPLFSVLLDEIPSLATVPPVPVCLANVGAGALDVHLSIIDLVDAETGCSGDEALFDQTCGNDGAGELSTLLGTTVTWSDCLDPEPFASGAWFDTLASANGALAISPVRREPEETSLRSGGTICVQLGVATLGGSLEMTQASQTDRVVWKFAFHGTVPATPEP